MKKPREFKTSVGLTDNEVGMLVGSLKSDIFQTRWALSCADDDARAALSEHIPKCEDLIKKIEAAFQRSLDKEMAARYPKTMAKYRAP